LGERAVPVYYQERRGGTRQGLFCKLKRAMWQKKLKKTIFTLNIDGYGSDIAKLTYPYMKLYADKIGAEFVEINTRKFPEYPVIYEKFQIYELTEDLDWGLFFDCDVLINPKLFDITEIIPEDTVSSLGVNPLDGHYELDNYFLRDGRRMSVGSCMMFASNLCREMWEPITDLTLEEILSRFHPWHNEELIGYTPDYLVDDYLISRNIAKYGLKYKALKIIFMEQGLNGVDFLYHEFGLPKEQKIKEIKEHITSWGY
jgi:hypothetical protein